MSSQIIDELKAIVRNAGGYMMIRASASKKTRIALLIGVMVSCLAFMLLAILFIPFRLDGTFRLSVFDVIQASHEARNLIEFNRQNVDCGFAASPDGFVDDLEIGFPIPSYCVNGDDINEESFVLYPVFNNEVLVAFLTVPNNAIGGSSVSGNYAFMSEASAIERQAIESNPSCAFVTVRDALSDTGEGGYGVCEWMVTADGVWRAAFTHSVYGDGANSCAAQETQHPEPRNAADLSEALMFSDGVHRIGL